jgi:L-ascorbate metabolism protein UlaG (beta-lactamase superfamily)
MIMEKIRTVLICAVFFIFACALCACSGDGNKELPITQSVTSPQIESPSVSTDTSLSLPAKRPEDVAEPMTDLLQTESNTNPNDMEEESMPALFYQGHGSYRLTAADGRVIYVDPYAGEGYDVPADIILVTHQHSDHNKVQLCAKKPDCLIITNAEALEGGAHNNFDINGILIQAVEAGNKNHNPKECVGYIITLDGVKIYASGDTSTTKQMETFAEMELDYAILCGDGVYNMDLGEAADCAKLIGAKHNIIVHLKPGALFDRDRAEQWDAPDKIIVEPGQEIIL